MCFFDVLLMADFVLLIHQTQDAKLPPSSKLVPSFPIMLYEMLEDSERYGFEQIVSWQLDGCAFKVVDKNSFVHLILPKYFNQTSYKSFLRQVNLYGFSRISKSKAKGGLAGGCYYHRYFVRGQKQLCSQIHRGQGKTSGAGKDSAELPEESASAKTNIVKEGPCGENIGAMAGGGVGACSSSTEYFFAKGGHSSLQTKPAVKSPYLGLRDHDAKAGMLSDCDKDRTGAQAAFDSDGVRPLRQVGAVVPVTAATNNSITVATNPSDSIQSTSLVSLFKQNHERAIDQVYKIFDVVPAELDSARTLVETVDLFRREDLASSSDSAE